MRDGGRVRQWWRVVLTVAPWVAVAVAVIGLGARRVDSAHQSLILLSSFAWLLTLSVVPVAVLFVAMRQWWPLTVVAAIVVAQVFAYAPVFVATPAGSGPTVRVFTQNLRLGHADAAQLVDHVRSGNIDILVVQELTPGELERLRQAGVDRLLPHSVTYPGEDSGGNGIWSRFPLGDTQEFGGQGAPGGVQARAELDDGRTLTVTGVHLAAPWPRDSDRWVDTLPQTSALMRLTPEGPGIVAGDFNATIDHARFRSILGDGWADAADQAGAGVVRSWPANRTVPPLLGLDHVLTRDAVAKSVRTVRTAGSDHLGLQVTVVISAE